MFQVFQMELYIKDRIFWKAAKELSEATTLTYSISLSIRVNAKAKSSKEVGEP